MTEEMEATRNPGKLIPTKSGKRLILVHSVQINSCFDGEDNHYYLIAEDGVIVRHEKTTPDGHVIDLLKTGGTPP